MTDSTRHDCPARRLIRDATVISMDPAVGDLARAGLARPTTRIYAG